MRLEMKYTLWSEGEYPRVGIYRLFAVTDKGSVHAVLWPHTNAVRALLKRHLPQHFVKLEWNEDGYRVWLKSGPPVAARNAFLNELEERMRPLAEEE